MTDGQLKKAISSLALPRRGIFDLFRPWKVRDLLNVTGSIACCPQVLLEPAHSFSFPTQLAQTAISSLAEANKETESRMLELVLRVGRGDERAMKRRAWQYVDPSFFLNSSDDILTHFSSFITNSFPFLICRLPSFDQLLKLQSFNGSMYALSALKDLVSMINSYGMESSVWRERARAAHMTKPLLADWMVHNDLLDILLRCVRHRPALADDTPALL